MCSFRIPLALVAATIALTPPLGAQDRPALQLYGGFGLEVVGFRDGSRTTPGPVLQAGIVRQVAGSRFGARFDVTYYQRDRSYIQGYDGSETALGASAALMYDFATSAWRPYGVGGVGVYRRSGPSGANPARQSSGALIGGLGLRRAIGRAQVFGELRYHHFILGASGGQPRLPLTFGIRF